MIKIDCDFCGKELDEPSALLFGPPDKQRSMKWHICVDCYCVLIDKVGSQDVCPE